MKKWWVLFGTCLVMIMLGIDATALNIAIPVIASEFYASLSSMQWVVNAFFLFAAMTQIGGGHLGDKYGHKKIFLISVLIFALSSLGAGLSVDENMLVVFRALQGASIGIGYPSTVALISSIFPKNQQSFARSFLVVAMGMSLAGGPPLGGLFVHTIGWRWIFFINIPLCILSYVIVQWCYPSKAIESKKKIDLRGLALLILALFGITFALNQVQNWGFLSFKFPLFFFGGILLLYILYLHERNAADPIIDYAMFKKRSFLINNILRFFVQIIFVAMLFFLPLYLQNIGVATPVVSGLAMLSLTLVMMIVSPFIGKWVDWGGDKKANIICMLVFVVATLFFFFLKAVPDYYLLGTCLCLFGVSIAAAYISTNAGALVDVPEHKIGVAMGLYLTVAWLGCAASVAFSGTLIAYQSRFSLLEGLQAEHITLNGAQLEWAERVGKGLAPVSSLIEKIPANIASKVEQLSASAFMEGIYANAWMFLAVSILGIFLAFFLKNPKRSSV